MSKFTINSKSLLAALNVCGKALGNNITIANSCYRLTMGNQLTVTACNNQVSIAVKVDAKGDKVDILIPNNIKAWVATLADQPLTFEISELDITIKSASGNCDFVGYDAEDFPTIKTNTSAIVELPFEAVITALYRTSYSKLTDSTGNILNAISVEIDSDKATFVSYNGFAFAKYVLDGTFEPMELLLPDSIVSTLNGLAISGDCTMTYSPKNIAFVIGDTEIKCVLMDGKYIAYKHGLIIPENTATCERLLLIDAIKRVLLFSSQLDQMIRIQFSQIGIMVTGTDVKMKNNAQERLVAKCSADLIVGLNGKMLIEALSHLGSEEITLSYNQPNTPIYIHENIDDESFAMIAPIML